MEDAYRPPVENRKQTEEIRVRPLFARAVEKLHKPKTPPTAEAFYNIISYTPLFASLRNTDTPPLLSPLDIQELYHIHIAAIQERNNIPGEQSNPYTLNDVIAYGQTFLQTENPASSLLDREQQSSTSSRPHTKHTPIVENILATQEADATEIPVISQEEAVNLQAQLIQETIYKNILLDNVRDIACNVESEMFPQENHDLDKRSEANRVLETMNATLLAALQNHTPINRDHIERHTSYLSDTDLYGAAMKRLLTRILHTADGWNDEARIDVMLLRDFERKSYEEITESNVRLLLSTPSWAREQQLDQLDEQARADVIARLAAREKIDNS